MHQPTGLDAAFRATETSAVSGDVGSLCVGPAVLPSALGAG